MPACWCAPTGRNRRNRGRRAPGSPRLAQEPSPQVFPPDGLHLSGSAPRPVPLFASGPQFLYDGQFFGSHDPVDIKQDLDGPPGLGQAQEISGVETGTEGRGGSMSAPLTGRAELDFPGLKHAPPGPCQVSHYADFRGPRVINPYPLISRVL